jgi:hypothetical protein
MAWNLDLCVNWDKKVLVPFHYLVEPNIQQCRTEPSQTFPFLRLSTDVQLIVYEHCDLPTLFQLMQTCSRTRGAAAKLFWTNPPESHWYYFPYDVLFEYGRRGHAIIEHCPEFSQRITKIEVSLSRLEFVFAAVEERVSTTEKAENFWNRATKAFPALQKIVLTSMLPRPPLPPPVGEFDKDYANIEAVVGCAPLQIQVQIAFEDISQYSARYTLWQFIKNASPTWHVINADWTPIRVLLPPRQFPPSPLGDVLAFIRLNSDLDLEKRGLRWLKMESYAHYAIDSMIYCPYPDCDATFPERTLWEKHLKDTSHGRLGFEYGHKGDTLMEWSCCKETPNDTKEALEARQKSIDRACERQLTLMQRIVSAYGEEESEERRIFERQFFAQLREENFGRPGELSLDHWLGLLETLRMFLGQTHVCDAEE